MASFARHGAMSAVLVAAGLTLTAAGTSTPASAQSGGIPGTTTCKPFTASKWVNPYPPHEVGKHYQVTIEGTAFTCKTADAYVVKFVAQKIKGSSQMPTIGKVTGGPGGFKCTSGISNNHTAYQGNCQSLSPGANPSGFNWGPYNDS